MKSKVVFLEDGFVFEQWIEWTLDFDQLGNAVASLTQAMINYAQSEFGKTLTPLRCFMPTYRLGSLT